MSRKPSKKNAPYEQAVADSEAQLYVLRLCVSGMTPRSRTAIVNVKEICERYLHGRYQLEVLDLYQQPELAAKHQVLATPTLLKSLPPPLRRLIGDLSDTRSALQRLGVVVKEEEA